MEYDSSNIWDGGQAGRIFSSHIRIQTNSHGLITVTHRLRSDFRIGAEFKEISLYHDYTNEILRCITSRAMEKMQIKSAVSWTP